jgi:predicted DNA-binding transcriptional regulator AlpA
MIEKQEAAGGEVSEAELRRFIGVREVSSIAGFSKSTILRKIDAGEFPEPVIQPERDSEGKLKGNCTRWDAAQVYAWRAELLRRQAERLKAGAAEKAKAQPIAAVA